MVELPPNAEYYTYRAKSGVEREGKLKEFLRRDSKCDQMSKSDSSSTPYWKASIQKDHLHSECQSICFFFIFYFLAMYTLLGNANGAPCAFPFKFEKKWYADCTSAGRSDGWLWCGTTTDYDTDKLFGYCPLKCK